MAVTATDLTLPTAAVHRSSSAKLPAELDIGDLFRAVVPRWRYLVVTLAMTLALAGAYVLLTPARYAATMSLMVDTRERLPVGSDAASVPQSPDTAVVENEMRLLLSNTVLKRVWDSEQLNSHPDFGGRPAGLSSLIGSLLGGVKPATPSDLSIAEALGRAIVVKRADKSNVIDVEVRASQSDLALRLAQALVKAYFDVHAEMDNRIAENESAWLDGRIADLRSRLEQAEARVQAYRKANSIVVTAGLTPSEQQLKDADAALISAHGKRTEAEARYQQSIAATPGGATETIRSPVMEKLRAEYAALARDAAQAQSMLGPRHPSYISIQSQLAAQRALIDREIGNIKDALRHELAAAREVERAAEANITKLKETINQAGDKQLGLIELEQQAESLRQSYQKGLAARQTTQRVIVSSPNPVLISPPAVLASRVSPKTLPALIIAVAAAINLWIVAALLMEYAARKRRVEGARAGEEENLADPVADVALDSVRIFSVAFALPEFEFTRLPENAIQCERDGNALERAMQVMVLPGHPYRVSIAKLHAYLQQLDGFAKSTPVVAVTARSRGDGASTFALSLALLACDRGQHVLLLDCDLKHPTLAMLLPHLPLVDSPIDSIDLFGSRHDTRSGGRILIGRYDNDCVMPNRGSLRERFDLIILDLGAETRRPERLVKEIDAEILLERLGGERRRRALFRFPDQANVQRREPQPIGLVNLAGNAAA